MGVYLLFKFVIGFVPEGSVTFVLVYFLFYVFSTIKIVFFVNSLKVEIEAFCKSCFLGV